MKMMGRYSVAALAWLSIAACATKGYVRTQVAAATDTSRAAYTAADAAIKSEMTTQLSSQISGVRASVDSVKADVASLRTDLNSLRTDFNAKVTALEEGTQFIFPVNFAFDDATIRDQDHAALDRFAKVVNKHYAGSIVTVVIAYLNQAGLSGVTLRPVGLGETRLVVEGASRDMPGAEANRRVVFVIEGKGQGTMAGDASGRGGNK
jgi:outer membrane protein OmpA-like peptidoglycan-associated protein